MALGGAYGGGGLEGGMGVPRIADKDDGTLAIFADFAALQTYYNGVGIEKPEPGYAAVVGTTDVNGELATLVAAYVWNFDKDKWENVVNDLIGQAGKDGRATIMRGLYSNTATYNRADLVRYQAVGGSNKIGLYQCLVDGTVGKTPNTEAEWILLLEETYIAPVHREFKVELLVTSTPSSPAAIDGAFTEAVLKWNVQQWSADDERITQVQITDPDGNNTVATAAQLRAQEVTVSKRGGWTRPVGSHTVRFTVAFTTSKGTVKRVTHDLAFNNRYYYGYSDLGDTGTPLTVAEVLTASKFGVGNTATFPQTLTITRTQDTEAYGYLLVSKQSVLPDEYDLRLFPVLGKQGELRIRGVDYQIYRTFNKTHATSLTVRAK